LICPLDVREEFQSFHKLHLCRGLGYRAEDSQGVGIDFRAQSRLELSAEAPVDLDLGLLFDPNSNKVVMAGQVTIGQMRRFVDETRYTAEGNNSQGFNKQIQSGDASAFTTFTNETDCLAFARWALSKVEAQYHNQGIEILTLGLPDDKQWVEMRQVFSGQQQTGIFWERLASGFFRSFLCENRNCSYFGAESRCDIVAFRLVGTYRKIIP